MDADRIKAIIAENMEVARKGSFRKRDAYAQAASMLGAKHILSLTGIRRCGKSTLMKELVRAALKKTSKSNILYLNLENPFFNQYRDDPSNLQRIYDIFREGCDGRKKAYVFLDEIQFFSDWQVFVKNLYEKNEAKIVLVGSNSRLLSSELSTLLSGRAVPLQMHAFSIDEAKSDLDTYLSEGGFPEIVLKEGPQKQLAETYYRNILYQDIIPRFRVENVPAIENLSYYLISNFGKEISYNTLKSISHLDDKTAKQYISHLQDANLLYSISNYDFSLKKLIGNKKKVYLADPLFTKVTFRNSPDKGKLFENHVFMTLKRAGFEIYFYQNKGECDFIIKEGFRITAAIQACYELTPENRGRETKNLTAALKKFGLKEGFIVTRSQKESFTKDGFSVKVITEKNLREKFG